MLLRRLAISNFRHHPMRVTLTVTAIALAVSLVVAVTGGYASFDASVQKFIGQFLGSWDAQIRRPTDARPGIDAALVGQLRQDRDVRNAIGRLETELLLIKKDGTPVPGNHAQVFGIDRATDDTPDKLRLDEGRWFNEDELNAVVIDQGTKEKTGVGVGETLTLPGTDKKLELTVTGVAHKPAIFAGYFQSMYVPLATLQKFLFEAGQTNRVSKIQIQFNPEVDRAAFVERWNAKLQQFDPLLQLKLTRDRREEIDKDLQAVQILSYMGGTVSMLAATFIVFSTVSMGVSERLRALAMLRAVGLLKSQVIRLVLLEGALLGAAGAAVGVPLGTLWIKILIWNYPALFIAGTAISPGGIAFAVVGIIFAAVVASIMPAVGAARIDPLEAMATLAHGRASRTTPPLMLTLVGLALISLDPIAAFVRLPAGWQLEYEREIRFYAHFILGLPGLMIGFFLLAPLFVWLIDKLLSRPVGAMLGVGHALVRQQLSGGLWRAAGTCAALMVGLSVLVVMHTQGHTALMSWQLPDKFPDVFVYTTSRAGLDRTAQERVANTPGIKPGETMPIAMFAPQFGSSIFGIAGAAFLPNATMYFGIDPEKAFDMLHLDFRQGNPKDAARMLKKGRHLVVTEEFHKLKGLNVGDTLPLLSLTRGRIDFTIAGIVWSPGMDVMASTFDMGKQFEQRTAASVFGSLKDAKELFGVENVYLVAANLELSVPKQQIIDQLQKDLGDMGLNVADVRHLKYDIEKTFKRLLLVASTVAWAAMAVASLGVTNTVMASIRSRRWQFGILRSIGVTRDQLLRLVLCEAILLGLVAVALGLGAGFVMALDAHELYAVLFGRTPPLRIPWGMVWTGAGIVMLVALLASIGPALRVARQEPLTLLQAGRAAA